MKNVLEASSVCLDSTNSSVLAGWNLRNLVPFCEIDSSVAVGIF